MNVRLQKASSWFLCPLHRLDFTMATKPSGKGFKEYIEVSYVLLLQTTMKSSNEGNENKHLPKKKQLHSPLIRNS